MEVAWWGGGVVGWWCGEVLGWWGVVGGRRVVLWYAGSGVVVWFGGVSVGLQARTVVGWYCGSVIQSCVYLCDGVIAW